jgi:hypothetical protein
MKNNDEQKSIDTGGTTRSMKEKAHVISRCVINILKMFRFCKRKKSV